VGIGGETISMTGVAAASKCRLDEFMPEWKVRSAHRTMINGSAADVFRALQSTDFSASKVISTLMAIRSFGRHFSSVSNQSLPGRLAVGGVLLLAEDAQSEVVFGVIGRFWLPVGNVCNRALLGFSSRGSQIGRHWRMLTRQYRCMSQRSLLLKPRLEVNGTRRD
jgi:hypothetical protein